MSDPKAISGNITNLFLYNKYVNDTDDAPYTDSGSTEALRYIIEETCSLIEQKCGRAFGTATYKEWIPAKGESYIVVHNYPITAVKLISTSNIDLINISNTGNPLATVVSDELGITLNTIGSDGTETNTTLLYADSTNVADLVIALNLIAGWTATTLGNGGTALTQLIRPISSGWAVDEQVCLTGPYLGSDIRISYDSDAIIDLGGSSWDNGWGDVYGYGEVFCWYIGGYTLPECDDAGANSTVVGNVPQGLTKVANEIVLDTMRQRDEDMNMASEKIGDYSYTRDGMISCVDRRWKDLNQWARKAV
jgi:hypothetical protein